MKSCYFQIIAVGATIIHNLCTFDNYICIFDIDPLPHSTCERQFEKIGCFVDKTGQQGALRTLPTLLVNDRDVNSDANDGHVLDWHKWPESIHR